MKNILLIVDPQNDFITGSLAVEGAEEKMKKLSEYISDKRDQYDYIFVTLDSHPKDHCSFKENGGIWPEHCVFDTNGWSIPKYLEDALKEHSNVTYYHKGTELDKEEYSIFDNCEDGMALLWWIEDILRHGDVFVDVCGIAGDYCVLETVKGLQEIVDPAYIAVLDEYTVSIDKGETLVRFLENNDINIIEDSTLNLEQLCL